MAIFTGVEESHHPTSPITFKYFLFCPSLYKVGSLDAVLIRAKGLLSWFCFKRKKKKKEKHIRTALVSLNTQIWHQEYKRCSVFRYLTAVISYIGMTTSRLHYFSQTSCKTWVVLFQKHSSWKAELEDWFASRTPLFSFYRCSCSAFRLISL